MKNLAYRSPKSSDTHVTFLAVSLCEEAHIVVQEMQHEEPPRINILKKLQQCLAQSSGQQVPPQPSTIHRIPRMEGWLWYKNPLPSHGQDPQFKRNQRWRTNRAMKGPKKNPYKAHPLGFPSFGHIFGLQRINQSVVLTWAQEQGAPIGIW